MNKRWEIDLVFAGMVKGLDMAEGQILTADELQELKALDDQAWEERWAQERDTTHE